MSLDEQASPQPTPPDSDRDAPNERTVANFRSPDGSFLDFRLFQLIVESAQDYAIFMLDCEGRVASWNIGAERITGYKSAEIIGQHFSCLSPPEARQPGRMEQILATARSEGRFELEGWRVRKDGTRYWADVVITALRNETGELIGFSDMIRDLTERRKTEEQLELRVKERTAELRAAYQELDTFSYTVSHDLRAPLRGIDGFSQALLEDCAGKLNETELDYLHRVRAEAQRMGQLIDDLLELSRVTRMVLRRERVNLSQLANQIIIGLQRREPNRKVDFVVAKDLFVDADERLLRIALENLLGNAWKFSGRHPRATIEVGAITVADGTSAWFVRDDGVGFDIAFAERLFGAFQRLHRESEFPGTGIGLATVQRIIHRHGGRVWAESAPGQGATFYFTLGTQTPPLS